MTGMDDPRLTAYAVDEGDEPMKAEVASSPALRAEAEAIAAVSRLLSEALAGEPAPALTPEQKDAIETESWRPRRSRASVVRWTASLAAVLAVAAGLGSRRYLQNGLPEPRRSAEVSKSTALPKATVPVPKLAKPKAVAAPRAASNAGVATDAAQPATRPSTTRPAANATNAPPPVLGASVAPTVAFSASDQLRALGYIQTAQAAKSGYVSFEASSADMRRQSAPYNREAYAHRADSDFLTVAQSPLSTFSIDVDTASYSNVRRFLNDGRLPPPDAVRIEEMVNYFPYDDAPPADGEPFAAHIEVAPAPWKKEHRLVRIGLKTRDLGERPDSNLVFLVDVSGSMMGRNRLPLVKQSLRLLVEKLTERDRVAMVVYAGSAGEALPPTRGDRRSTILDAIDRLEAGGSTNGGEGLQLAYDLAARHFIRGGVNRVILATDGDFNVGTTDEGSLVRLVERKAKTGVFLSVFGFGMGNYQDSRLESLADKGNGNYGYIDTVHEARKALVEQMDATLVTVAKDVKVQVEFNPAKVQSYRLIGYENRRLQAEDFKDDTKDAGEVGAGHSVTALYEIVPAGATTDGGRDVDPLRYQQKGGLTDAARSGELLRLKLRYKDPEGQQSRPKEWPVADRTVAIEETSKDFRFAAAVAELGMILRDSPHKGEATLDGVLALAEAGRGEDRFGHRAELIALVHKAKALRSAQD